MAIQIQTVVRPEQTLQQPASEKAGAACDKDSFTAQLTPEIARVLQYVIKISGEWICHSYAAVSHN
jgi:hypothetical protein